jgi:hypothetical protein
MLSIIFSLIPFIFIIYYTIMVKNTKYVTMDLRNGEMCYCCKGKIEMDRNDVMYNILNNVTNYRICKSCQRDEKLDEIVNHSKLSKLNKFKFFLLSEKYDKFARYLLFSLVILVFFDITLKIVFDIKWFSPIYNLYLVCYWLLIIYRHRLMSIKKP